MILTTLLFFSLTASAAEKSVKTCENVANFVLKQNGYKSFNRPDNGKTITDAFAYNFSLHGKNTIRVGHRMSPGGHSFISITQDRLKRGRVLFLDQNCRITSVWDEIEKNGQMTNTNLFTSDLCNSMLDNKKNKKVRADGDRIFVVAYKKKESHKDIVIDDQNVDEVINFCTTYKPFLHTYAKEEMQPRLTKVKNQSNIKAH